MLNHVKPFIYFYFNLYNISLVTVINISIHWPNSPSINQYMFIIRTRVFIRNPFRNKQEVTGWLKALQDLDKNIRNVRISEGFETSKGLNHRNFRYVKMFQFSKCSNSRNEILTRLWGSAVRSTNPNASIWCFSSVRVSESIGCISNNNVLCRISRNIKKQRKLQR